MMKKTIASALLAFSNKSWAIPAVTAASAAASAGATGQDPIPWIIGGFGAAVVYVKLPPTTRPNALVNAGISIFAGGLIAPVVGEFVQDYFHKAGTNYAIAFILSCAWPWVITTGKAYAEKKGWL